MSLTRTTARSAATLALGRAARAAARLRGGGSGGTALPGLVMEKADPGLLARVLDQLPQGVVVVSGTNGKTTTTKMVVQLLQSQGLKVVTNRTGSNFVRGVLASLLTQVRWDGSTDADIAVLELDEAHAVRFVERVRPRACLLLNVMRDQLDRFGEIDHTASLLRQVARATSEVVVTNADDPRLGSAAFADGLDARVVGFATGRELASLFVSDDDLRAGPDPSPSPLTPPQEAGSLPVRVRLESLTGRRATISVDGVPHTVVFSLPGIHNQLNACAALALVLEVLGAQADLPVLLAELTRIQPAFGRGEVVTLDGAGVELSLVKNPAGFRMGLLSAQQAQRSAGGETIMIAINDEYADGRDMSWLWDVDLTSLRDSGVAVVTGVRAWDMALRLAYEEVPVGQVVEDLGEGLTALRQALAATREREDAPDGPGRRARVFTTYTAMLELRHRLGGLTEVEEVMR